jgi:hypothetical protein
MSLPAALALSPELAGALAELPLKSIPREFPNAPGHVWNDESDGKRPRELHPAFFGCLDWHSAVHGHWMLVRLLKEFRLPQTPAIRSLLNRSLTAENLRVEADYFQQPNRRSFERTYGWAWLLKLAEELHGWGDPDGRMWAANLRPLEETIVHRYLDFLPIQTYPIRSGTHPNTAFGLSFAYDYASTVGDEGLKNLIRERATTYYARDIDYPIAFEPSGADFFSPSLLEADLMRRILQPADFRGWFERFLPSVAAGAETNLFSPAIVSDRSDPQIAHLDGLNLSRAWCMTGIALSLPSDHPGRAPLLAAAERHAAAGLAHVASGHYEGDHWLGSFAIYLLSNR